MTRRLLEHASPRRPHAQNHRRQQPEAAEGDREKAQRPLERPLQCREQVRVGTRRGERHEPRLDSPGLADETRQPLGEARDREHAERDPPHDREHLARHPDEQHESEAEQTVGAEDVAEEEQHSVGGAEGDEPQVAADQEPAHPAPFRAPSMLTTEDLREAVAEEQREERVAAVVGEQSDRGVDPGVGGSIRHRLEQQADLATPQQERNVRHRDAEQHEAARDIGGESTVATRSRARRGGRGRGRCRLAHVVDTRRATSSAASPGWWISRPPVGGHGRPRSGRRSTLRNVTMPPTTSRPLA